MVLACNSVIVLTKRRRYKFNKLTLCFASDSPDLSAACTCWKAAATLVEETKALKCSAKSSYDNINALKKNCLSKFSNCKKAEDYSVGLIHVCNGGTTPSTAVAPTTAGKLVI